MPKYLFTGGFTADGARGVLGEGGTSRRAVVEKLFASLGGTLESYHFAFGSDDYYIIADLPGNAAAAAGALTTSASGAVHTRTVVLLTPEEVDAATKLSPSYRPPGR
ncbi:MAG: GYD domain-containing protein [Candidatus Limnocylindrales bacterium]